jgi:hypothetical protein
VLAWGEKSKTAYIAPMEVLFEDIKKILGAEGVALPIPEAGGGKIVGKAMAMKEDSGIGMGSLGEDVALKLRDLRIDEGRRSSSAGGVVPSGAASTSTSSAAAGAPGSGGKTKGVVGVRPLVIASAVS